jgi:hypothetical protein
MGFYSTHKWLNGAITTVERVSDTELNIRVQNDKEEMLTDIVMGEYEAICLAHSILSVLANKEAE